MGELDQIFNNPESVLKTEGFDIVRALLNKNRKCMSRGRLHRHDADVARLTEFFISHWDARMAYVFISEHSQVDQRAFALVVALMLQEATDRPEITYQFYRAVFHSWQYAPRIQSLTESYYGGPFLAFWFYLHGVGNVYFPNVQSYPTTDDDVLIVPLYELSTRSAEVRQWIIDFTDCQCRLGIKFYPKTFMDGQVPPTKWTDQNLIAWPASYISAQGLAGLLLGQEQRALLYEHEYRIMESDCAKRGPVMLDLLEQLWKDIFSEAWRKIRPNGRCRFRVIDPREPLPREEYFVREGVDYPSVMLVREWRYSFGIVCIPTILSYDNIQKSVTHADWLNLFENLVGVVAYHKFVCTPPSAHDCDQADADLPEPRSIVPVVAHFRRLHDENWKPDPKKILEAIIEFGYMKAGCTFVKQSERPVRAVSPHASENFRPEFAYPRFTVDMTDVLTRHIP